MLALESKNVVGGVFNIASGTAITVYELAKILQQITDMERLKQIFVKRRAGDIKHCSGDICKAEENLGFRPKIQLEDGLSKLLNGVYMQHVLLSELCCRRCGELL